MTQNFKQYNINLPIYPRGTCAIISTFLFHQLERAVMIRKLEHDRDKLASQLELSQESASQAKKVARESEIVVKSERAKTSKLESELKRLVEQHEQLEETGDFAQQESAKIKHMLLLAESQLGTFESQRFNNLRAILQRKVLIINYRTSSKLYMFANYSWSVSRGHPFLRKMALSLCNLNVQLHVELSAYTCNLRD